MGFAQKHKILAIQKSGNSLTLATTDPANILVLDEVKRITRQDIQLVVAVDGQISEAISEYYGIKERVANELQKTGSSQTRNFHNIQINEANIIATVDSLIKRSIAEKASDIHIEPFENESRVRFRIDGVLREVLLISPATHLLMISRIKIMSEMDITERRASQDGRINITIEAREIDIRVSTIPTIYGEKMVLRILDKDATVLDLEKIGFSKENLSIYQNLYRHSHGIILLTGPTGSGKTTTLYSTLMAINSIENNIITLENPVEYRLPGINQVQVNVKTKLDFANGLRAILRQDPNVIMVGEIRDKETADIAMRAALTGHLVLSTLHTNDAVGAITRLLDLQIEPFLVASSVLGVVSQRLVRRLCEHCRRKYMLTAGSAEQIFLERFSFRESWFYVGEGCSKCGFSGYRGRVAIHEVLSINEKLRIQISRKKDEELRETAVFEGMKTLSEDGINKALDGVTSLQEIMRVAFYA